VSLQSITISLRAHYSDGRNVTSDSFLSPLEVGTPEVVEVLSDRGPWASALVVFARMQLSDYSASAEPYEAFSAALQARLDGIASWLGRQSAEAFRQMHSNDLVTDLFFDAWIDDDQFDLSLPASLLSSCGRLGLSIVMTTND
jgi:hypothetical protein